MCSQPEQLQAGCLLRSSMLPVLLCSISTLRSTPRRHADPPTPPLLPLHSWLVAYCRSLMCHLRPGEDLRAELEGKLKPEVRHFWLFVLRLSILRLSALQFFASSGSSVPFCCGLKHWLDHERGP